MNQKRQVSKKGENDQKAVPGDYQQMRLALCKFIFHRLDTAGKADAHSAVLCVVDFQVCIRRQSGFMLTNVGHRIVCFHVLKIVKFCGLSTTGGLSALNYQFIAFHD